MDLSTISFLFVIFPLFVGLYFIIRPGYRKWVLLVVSIGVYCWYRPGEIIEVFLIIFLNYIFLFFYTKFHEKANLSQVIFWGAISFNILVFIFYKLVSTNNLLYSSIIASNILSKVVHPQYPMGLSFILFQNMSCLFETYRNIDNYPSSVWDYLLYIIYFPKLFEGPITRWPQFNQQIHDLDPSFANVIDGVERFIIGFAKKTLIADQLAFIVNAGFGLSYPAYNTLIAWLIIVCFCIQIYYDFSGYIDMVLGFSQLLGIRLPENFNRPYDSLSISDFWRRWHISLSSWFRDYVFMPLEFSRRHKPYLRQEYNILIIFVLTGLWHGFSLNYLLWGILQGLFICFESSKIGRVLKKLPRILQRFYFWGALLISWILFRSPTVLFSIRFIKRLFSYSTHVDPLPFSVTQPLPIINNSVYFVLIVGIIGLLPLSRMFEKVIEKTRGKLGFQLVWYSLLITLLIASLSFSASQSFIPSIYGKF